MHDMTFFFYNKNNVKTNHYNLRSNILKDLVMLKLTVANFSPR